MSAISQLFGGPGDDQLFGDAGEDTLDGGNGTNLLVAGSSMDTCPVATLDTRISCS